MDYFEFVCGLKLLACEKDLRLFMGIPDVGYGFFFYFKDMQSEKQSDHIIWDEGRESPDALFGRLRNLAETFKQNVDVEVAVDE